MIKDSIRCYICRSKFNILPKALPRISWDTTTILRLTRRLHHMKYYFINRINNFVRKRNNIPLHHIRKNHIKPANLIPCTHKTLGRMITKLPTNRTRVLRTANYFTD